MAKGYSDSHLQTWWRRAVKAVNGECCIRCGSDPVEVHHVVKRRHALLRHDWRNGIPLCAACHRWVETLAGKLWVADQVDMRYLLAHERENIKDYLRDHGLNRREFDQRTLEELKRVVAENE